jgi:hypothetical protein
MDQVQRMGSLWQRKVIWYRCLFTWFLWILMAIEMQNSRFKKFLIVEAVIAVLYIASVPILYNLFEYSVFSYSMFIPFSIMSGFCYVLMGITSRKYVVLLNIYMISIYIMSCFYIKYIAVYWFKGISTVGFWSFHPWYETHVGIPSFVLLNLICAAKLFLKRDKAQSIQWP